MTTRGGEQVASGPGGEMAARIAAFDWASSPLGTRDEWSPALRASLDIALASRFPFILWWGPEMIVLYNDAYVPFFGSKHPGALGQPGLSPAAWGDEEVRRVIEPMLRSVYDRGDATWSEDQLLILERHGFPEETYFKWSYSPIFEAGEVVGIFTAVTETSTSVIGARRLSVLSDLTAATFEAPTAAAVCLRAAEVLDGARREVPFHLIYLTNAAGDAELVAGTPEAVACAPAPGAWVSEAGVDIATRIVDLAAMGVVVPSGDWPEPVSRAAVVPLIGAGEQRRTGFMVIGLSPRLLHDDRYIDFVRLAAVRVTSGISDARALEEERRRAEALAQLDRSKSVFFSNVSHEFRTPLTLMLGPLDDALAEGAPVPWPVQEERLSTARANGLRLLKLVNTLLDFSRLEAGRPQINPSTVDVTALTEDLASVFRSAFAAAGLDFQVDVEKFDQLVELDVDMWETVVFNLLSNALKYTTAGQVEVGLHRHGDGMVLAVADTGSGIPSEDRDHVFERFYRVSSSGGRSLEGTGIGLALVRELLALHGGTIEVDSEVGRGSTFTVRLPLRASAATVAQPVHGTGMRAESFLEETRRWLPDGPAAETPVTEGPRPHVVVADDNADMRRYLRNLLQDRYEVTLAADGAKALEEVRRRRPDAVVSDVMMPVLDGFGFLHAVRSDEELHDLPVMLLSARAGSEATGEGLERGADDYLVKPFAARELRARVEALLSASARMGGTERDRLRRQRRAAAADMAAALNSVTDVQHLAETVFGSLGPAWDLVAATIGLLEPDGAHVKNFFGGDDRTPQLTGRLGRLAIDAETPHARAVRDGVPQLFATRAELAGAFPAIAADAREHGVEGAVTLPFVAADQRVFGALTLGWRTPLDLDADTVTELSDIAEVVARATERVITHETQRDVAAGLQRSMLTLEVRSTNVLSRALYRSAQAELEVGGDWYDAIDLGSGRVAVAVGDVVGRGLAAAATMGQLRAAMAAAALAAAGPSETLDILDRYAAQLPGALCATAALAFVDTAAAELRYCRAGHLPPLVVTPDGAVNLLEGGGSWPFNVGREAPRPPAERVPFPAGSLLLLYTDGLVERRDESLQDGIERLAGFVARNWHLPLVDLERSLFAAMLDGRDRVDDVAMVAVRSAGESRGIFAEAVAADPRLVRPLRHRFTAWLRQIGVGDDDVDDLVLATAEALANAVEHGSGNDPDRVVGLEAGAADGTITVAVTDSGVWKAGLDGFLEGRGRGHTIIQALSNDLHVESDAHGTAVVLVHHLTEP